MAVTDEAISVDDVSYYDLPKDAQWLGGNDSPYCVGGHSTDIESLTRGLHSRLREVYPINGVPPQLVAESEALIAQGIATEQAIMRFIVNVGKDLAGCL